MKDKILKIIFVVLLVISMVFSTVAMVLEIQHSGAVETPVTDSKAIDGLFVSLENSDKIRLVSKPVTSSTFANDGIVTYSNENVVSVTNAKDIYTYHWSLSSGGSNYVDLSATTGTSVTVTVKSAFNGSYTLTCTAKYGGSTVNSATCTLRYRQRLQTFNLSGVDKTTGSVKKTIAVQGWATYHLYDFSTGISFLEACKATQLQFEPIYSVGSVSAYSLSSRKLAISCAYDNYTKYVEYSYNSLAGGYNFTFADLVVRLASAYENTAADTTLISYLEKGQDPFGLGKDFYTKYFKDKDLFVSFPFSLSSTGAYADDFFIFDGIQFL